MKNEQWRALVDYWACPTPLIETVFMHEPIAQCSDCFRLTWEPVAAGEQCQMIQPDGTNCKGTFHKREDA
jgi:hypothetical protein